MPRLALHRAAKRKTLWLGTAPRPHRLRRGSRLIYVTGGAAFGSLKFTPATNASETKTRIGWTAGAGVEYAFLGSWSAKVEYLYVDLGKTTCEARPAASTPTSNSRPISSALGLNYHF